MLSRKDPSLLSRLVGATALWLALLPSILPSTAWAGPVTSDFWFYSTVSSTLIGPLHLRAELNYDDARTDAPIAVVMHGYSPTNGNLDAVRAQAQRLRDAGFFAVSVAMRGRDGSAGVRDSGGSRSTTSTTPSNRSRSTSRRSSMRRTSTSRAIRGAAAT